MTLGVQSEVGQLRQAILHRPGLELSRLTPDNIGELLFDDVMWAKKAKEEHDAFAEALREKGVRVHYFGQLLGRDTRDSRRAGSSCSTGCAPPRSLGPTLVDPVRRLFEDLDGETLAELPGRRRPEGGPPPAHATQPKWDMLSSRRLPAGPAAEPSVPAGQLVLDLRRSVDQPDGQAGPSARVRCTAGRSTATTRCSPTRTSIVYYGDDDLNAPAGVGRRRRRPRPRARRRDDRDGRADDRRWRWRS